ncbi:MAG: flavodoxin-dependent (E)-4-hydroxy-3-methylbut-2-enyl-diphosphate synthase [Actinobacteria bacterium]|nr:flavodoxin-dependent (E)-4-hydroxy-3-methylbut-2-enyl-diphosphate synthase [Actinomycetota bacterium]MCL6088398.1 flavodoxin-dependent (E)-4-hydroxy-3-methylbut-2-enyl-diphosphate synthase [Actinomycetota bacterium]
MNNIYKRRKTREITIGSKRIGGNNPILVQSMTKNKFEQMDLLKDEIISLINSGCEIIRIAVTDSDSISHIRDLIREGFFENVPLVADIQFDCELAILALEAGAHCVRINPGNIGGPEKTKKIINKAKDLDSCIRIGVNSGSIDKKILNKFNNDCVSAMVESTLEYVRLFENMKFYNFKISAKASSVMDSIHVYKTLSEKINYPLHLGITEAGSKFAGAIKSSVGLGILLYEGIGDTIRVSLTDSSIYEVKAGYYILNSLNLRNYGIDIISCPTCGRTKSDLKAVAEEIERITANVAKPLKVAVMGCIVNGPGEAREADIGIAFGMKKAAVFVKGRILKRVEIEDVISEFTCELEKLI